MCLSYSDHSPLTSAGGVKCSYLQLEWSSVLLILVPQTAQLLIRVIRWKSAGPKPSCSKNV